MDTSLVKIMLLVGGKEGCGLELLKQFQLIGVTCTLNIDVKLIY